MVLFEQIVGKLLGGTKVDLKKIIFSQKKIQKNLRKKIADMFLKTGCHGNTLIKKHKFKLFINHKL